MPFDGNVLGGDETDSIARAARAVRPGYEGYAAIGDILGGGAQHRADANANRYLGDAASTAYKWNEAAKSRSDAIIRASQLTSRQALPGALGGIYTDPKEAALANAVLGSNDTINMGQLGDFQTPGHAALVQEQQDALGKGDFKRMNAVTAVLGDKQFEPVIAKGGAYIENGATLGDLDAIPTPEAAERINAIQAHTQQGQQRTDAAVRHSDRAPASHASTHHASVTEDETAILEQARAAIAKGADKGAVKKRLEDRGYSKVAGHL